jgi:preprotein translocase subunit SecG
MKKSDGGGAAMGGGASFQARGTAWLMTYMLAELPEIFR